MVLPAQLSEDSLTPCSLAAVTLPYLSLPLPLPMRHVLWSSQEPWMDMLVCSFFRRENKNVERASFTVPVLGHATARIRIQSFLTLKPMFSAQSLQVCLSLTATTTMNTVPKKQSRNDKGGWCSSRSPKSQLVKFLVWSLGLWVVHHGCVLVLSCVFFFFCLAPCTGVEWIAPSSREVVRHEGFRDLQNH